MTPDEKRAEMIDSIAGGTISVPGGYASLERDDAENIVDAILARFDVTERDKWEYGASWLEGDERVYMPTENDWRAQVEVKRMNQGYDFPDENYVVRRRPASEWEAIDE